MTLRHPVALAVASLLLSAPALARPDDARMMVRPENAPPPVPLEPTDEPGVLSGKLSETITAHVRSVDLGKREVTLHGSDGKVESFVAGPEVKNLEKLERGDRVQLRFRGGLVLRPLAAGDAVSPTVDKDTKRTGRGDTLSGVETVRARMAVTVVAVDPATRIVVLEGAEKRPVRVQLSDKIPLDRMKAGDRFTATWSAALAVSVDPVYRE